MSSGGNLPAAGRAVGSHGHAIEGACQISSSSCLGCGPFRRLATARAVAVALLRQCTVATVAQRRLAGVFTPAEKGLATHFRRVSLRREFRALMGTVAERLLRGLAAGAPVVSLAGLHFHGNGSTGCDNGVGHGNSPEGARLEYSRQAMTDNGSQPFAQVRPPSVRGGYILSP